jgi:hypothetical protein
MVKGKETFYFQHDYEPTSDPKMQAFIGEYGATGYGVYWRLIEMLHSNKDHCLPYENYIFVAVGKQMQVKPEIVKEMVQNCVQLFKLFKDDDACFWCERVLRNIEHRKEISEERAFAGKKSGEARRKKKEQTNKIEHLLNKSEQSKEKESKEKVTY